LVEEEREWLVKGGGKKEGYGVTEGEGEGKKIMRRGR